MSNKISLTCVTLCHIKRLQIFLSTGPTNIGRPDFLNKTSTFRKNTGHNTAQILQKKTLHTTISDRPKFRFRFRPNFDVGGFTEIMLILHLQYHITTINLVHKRSKKRLQLISITNTGHSNFSEEPWLIHTISDVFNTRYLLHE